MPPAAGGLRPPAPPPGEKFTGGSAGLALSCPLRRGDAPGPLNGDKGAALWPGPARLGTPPNATCASCPGAHGTRPNGVAHPPSCSQPDITAPFPLPPYPVQPPRLPGNPPGGHQDFGETRKEHHIAMPGITLNSTALSPQNTVVENHSSATTRFRTNYCTDKNTASVAQQQLYLQMCTLNFEVL